MNDEVSRRDFLEWMRRPARPEALFCYNDGMALSTIYNLSTLNLRVPQDVAVAGYDAVRTLPFPLTTMDPQHYEMGRAAALMAIEIVENGQNGTRPSVCVQPRLMARQSSLRHASDDEFRLSNTQKKRSLTMEPEMS